MLPQISAFRWVPAFAQGYVRDLWVRWALEEAGRRYDVVLIDPGIQASEEYRAWQPFGKVPAYRDAEVDLFESGAIVLHIAGRSDVLMPTEERGRGRVVAWILAALNTIDPVAQHFLDVESEAGTERRATAEAKLRERLASLSRWLGAKDYLEGRFMAGDILMAGVLRVLADSNLLCDYQNLHAYVQRCQSRPAFGRAFEAQMSVFRENAPA